MTSIAVVHSVILILLFLSQISAIHKNKIPVMMPSVSSIHLLENTCETLPGTWTGFEGTTPLYDEYELEWTSGFPPGVFTSVIIRGSGWSLGQGQVFSNDTLKVTIQFDTGLVLNGSRSENCHTIVWDNGSTWKKMSGIDVVHIVSMNHLDVGYKY